MGAVCKIFRLCGALSSLIIFQQITLKVGNFTEFEDVISSGIDGFFANWSILRLEKPWTDLFNLLLI